MLRGDFHHHIDADPLDGKFVRHSAGQLIDRAARSPIEASGFRLRDMEDT